MPGPPSLSEPGRDPMCPISPSALALPTFLPSSCPQTGRHRPGRTHRLWENRMSDVLFRAGWMVRSILNIRSPSEREGSRIASASISGSAARADRTARITPQTSGPPTRRARLPLAPSRNTTIVCCHMRSASSTNRFVAEDCDMAGMRPHVRCQPGPNVGIESNGRGAATTTAESYLGVARHAPHLGHSKARLRTRRERPCQNRR